MLFQRSVIINPIRKLQRILLLHFMIFSRSYNLCCLKFSSQIIRCCFSHGIGSIHLWYVVSTTVISNMVLIIILITDELKDVTKYKISILLWSKKNCLNKSLANRVALQLHKASNQQRNRRTP
uniref:Uncharacterized protein n=1 Tax=Arundo donax TaxID=35708 RepID=A0A0A9G458_ARUDO